MLRCQGSGSRLGFHLHFEAMVLRPLLSDESRLSMLKMMWKPRSRWHSLVQLDGRLLWSLQDDVNKREAPGRKAVCTFYGTQGPGVFLKERVGRRPANEIVPNADDAYRAPVRLESRSLSARKEREE